MDTFMQNSYKFNFCYVLMAVAVMVTLWGGHAWAAERLGTPVWDVNQVPSGTSWKEGKFIFVYGGVTIHGVSGTIRDLNKHQSAIDLDLRLLGRKERNRLRLQCAWVACSEIIKGFKVKDKIYLIDAIPYHSADQLAVGQILIH